MPYLPNIDESPLLRILEDSSDGIALVTASPWQLLYVNPTLAQWLGGSPRAFQGQAISEVFPAVGFPKLSEQLDHALGGEELPTSSHDALFLSAGSPSRVEIRLRRIVFDGQPLVGVTVRPASAEELVTGAVGFDPLTGLPDRSVLMARMAALLRGDRSVDRQFAVLFIDLDDFKQVNDAHGHLIGDRVLAEVARRLATCVRARDLIVRFGGDEFVALVENVFCSAEVQPVVTRIDAALSEPIALPDGEVILTASVGVAEAAEQHRTPEDLLRDADRAMYASKRLPR